MGEVVRGEMWKIVNMFWAGKGWPEEQEIGMIVPILKKGD